MIHDEQNSTYRQVGNRSSCIILPVLRECSKDTVALESKHQQKEQAGF